MVVEERGGMFGKKKATMLEGDTEWRVAGTSYRQKELKRLAGRKTEDGIDVEVIAALVPQPKNEHDRNAVAVQIDGKLVGFLSRDDAKHVQPALLRVLKRDKRYSACRGRIVGGWKRGRKDQGSYGVRLYFDIPE